MTRRPLIIMVTGAVPGLGKSSLCKTLTEVLRADGYLAERFDEEDILTSAAFREIIVSFRNEGRVAAEVLLRGAVNYAEAVNGRQGQIFVQDMLFPYLPSLLAWGYSDEEIAVFLSELGYALRCADVVEVHLEGDVPQAIWRACRREEEGWLDMLVAKVNRYADSGRVADTTSLAEYFDSAQARTHRLLARAPWPVLTLCADEGAGEVSHVALDWVRQTRLG